MNENNVSINPVKLTIIAIVMLMLVALVTSTITFLYTRHIYGIDGRISMSQVFDSKNEYALLDSVFKIIDEQYIEDVDKQALIEDAARGMVIGSGDVYGAYFTAEEFAEFTREDIGEYVGIGVLINIGDSNKITIAQVYKDSPAHASGILPGDIIVGVDDESIIGLDYTIVIDMVRGLAGTPVTITINRDGENMDFDMKRADIIAEHASWKMIDDKIGYMDIQEFSGNASELFHEGVLDMLEQGAQGLVLDLRNNPGGSKDLAVEIGDTLFPEGEIITLIDSSGNEDVDYSDKDYLDIPMVVLINGSSASASELIAGGIQDYGVGTLIGESTFGKGVAQSFHNVRGGGVVRITSSYYETAGGRCPQDVGIVPDIEVLLDEAVYQDISLMGTDQDNQLQKALEVLKEMMGLPQ